MILRAHERDRDAAADDREEARLLAGEKLLDDADALPGVKVFHAGTASNADGEIVSAGGRVLGVVAVGDDIAEAAKRAYDGVDAIVWPGGFVRRDIGWRAIARDEKKK